MGTPVVIDTNVLVSGLHWTGIPSKIIRLMLEKQLTLISSFEQIRELSRVLSYVRLQVTIEEQTEYLAVIESLSTIVITNNVVNLVPDDPSDNIFLEMAMVGGAHFIITGDKHLLRIRDSFNIKIVTPSEFLDLWESHRNLN